MFYACCRILSKPAMAEPMMVRPEYWPYAGREGQPSQPSMSRGIVTGVAGESGGELGAYVERVREMCSKPACVQAGFGPANERLAADWQRAGVSLETVRRAILLGSVRKLMSMIDRLGSKPVRSLRYFAGLVEEVRQERMTAGFWQHLEISLERCERSWRQRTERVPGSACSYLDQAVPLGGGEFPSAVNPEPDEETG